MTRDYIRNYLTYSLPGNLTKNEWEVVLNNIETLLAEEREAIKSKLKDNQLGGFIAETKTDDNEKLWVRIDNYFGESPSGEIILIDRKKLELL